MKACCSPAGNNGKRRGGPRRWLVLVLAVLAGSVALAWMSGASPPAGEPLGRRAALAHRGTALVASVPGSWARVARLRDLTTPRWGTDISTGSTKSSDCEIPLVPKIPRKFPGRISRYVRTRATPAAPPTVTSLSTTEQAEPAPATLLARPSPRPVHPSVAGPSGYRDLTPQTNTTDFP